MAAIFPPLAAPAEPATRITIKAGTTTLTERFNVSWQDIGNDLGSGTFTLLRDDSQNSLLDIGTLITCQIDGTTRFRWHVETIEDTVVSLDEEAAEVTVYSGRSTARVLEAATIYPATGVYTVPTGGFAAGLTVGYKPYGTERHMGWPEPSYDDSGWSAATNVLTPAGDFRPEGFPDPDARWIWFEAASGGEHPVGDTGLFRDTFNDGTDDVFSVDIFFAALDQADVYVDDVLIASTDVATDLDVGQHARWARVQINGNIDHTLAFSVFHRDAGLAGLLYTVYKAGTNTVIARSSTGTLTVDAATEPSMTPGSVVLQAIDEAVARGCIPNVTTTFTATEDSGGDNWPNLIGDFTVRIGDTLLDVLGQLSEGWIEWAMVPDGTYGQVLSMWVAPGLDLPGGGTGTGRGSASGVTYEKGVNCTELTRIRGGTSLRNTSLIVWGDGYLEGQITESEGTYGRLESFLSIPSVTSGPSALWTAAATLQPISEPEDSVTVGIEPTDSGDVPYTDIGIGDTATLTTPSWSIDMRLSAITVTEDEDGNILWAPEFGTSRELLEQRWERWLRRTANGTLDGRSRNATLSSPSVEQSGRVTVVTHTFSTAGGVEPIAGDRGTPQRPRELTLFYRAEIEADVAGITDDTDVTLLEDDSSRGTVTLPDSGDTGVTDLATTFMSDPSNLLNIEVATAGGHTGVTVKLLGVGVGI